jgi:hypothetical protein
MKYLFIAIVVVVAGWFFFFRGQDAPPASAPLPPPSPEQQFEALFAGTPVEAVKLGALCQAYPQLAERYLRDRSFRLSGTVQDFRLGGLDGRRAEILLQTGTKRQLVVVYDLDQYEGLNVHERLPGRYAIVGVELFRVNSAGAGKNLICTKGQPFLQSVATKNVGASFISFSAAAK